MPAELAVLSSLVTAAYRRVHGQQPKAGPNSNLINLLVRAQRRLGTNPDPKLIEAIALAAKTAFGMPELSSISKPELFMTDLIRAGRRILAENLTASDQSKITAILNEELNYPSRIKEAQAVYDQWSKTFGLEPVRRAFVLRNIRVISLGGKPVAQMTREEFVKDLVDKEEEAAAACAKILGAKEDRSPLKIT